MPSLPIRPAVAVLGLENLPGRPGDDWLAIYFTQILATELRAGSQVRVVPSGEVTRARRELSSGSLTDLTGEDLARLGRRLGGRECRLGNL